MDGRRRQWLAMDPGFYSNTVTTKLFKRFGNAGVIVFDAFLRACKTSFVEGQITYANSDQFLNVVGLPPDFELVDNLGEKWELDQLWRVLGDHHMTARRRQHDRTTIVARRWDDWQKRRSKPRNTESVSRLTTTSTVTMTPLPPTLPLSAVPTAADAEEDQLREGSGSDWRSRCQDEIHAARRSARAYAP